MISQLEPMGAMMPRASSRRPTSRTSVPQRSGLLARIRLIELATSWAKLVIEFVQLQADVAQRIGKIFRHSLWRWGG